VAAYVKDLWTNLYWDQCAVFVETSCLVQCNWGEEEKEALAFGTLFEIFLHYVDLVTFPGLICTCSWSADSNNSVDPLS
jgi:hypothetical protein